MNGNVKAQPIVMVVKAQLIVKVLIFMIMGDYAVVQRLDDMELWQ